MPKRPMGGEMEYKEMTRWEIEEELRFGLEHELRFKKFDIYMPKLEVLKKIAKRLNLQVEVYYLKVGKVPAIAFRKQKYGCYFEIATYFPKNYKEINESTGWVWNPNMGV